MKTVILAEKPSQAKAYAETFKKRIRHEGYYEIVDPLFSGEVTITYGFGHLVDMVPPGAYEERWSKWSLPIFPETFRYEVPKENKHNFQSSKRNYNQRIRSLLRQMETVKEKPLLGRLSFKHKPSPKAKSINVCGSIRWKKRRFMKALKTFVQARAIFLNIKKRKLDRMRIG